MLLVVFYAATTWLWLAARASAAAALETQIRSVLAGDLAEGNLFKLGASLSRLMQGGSLDYAEIRSFSRKDGWEKIFRTHSHYGDTDRAFSGFSCGKNVAVAWHRKKGMSLVTTLPGNIAGSECVALLVSSDVPPALKKFKDRLSIAFILLLTGIILFFLRLTMSWHKRTLGLEVAARTAQAEKEAAVGRMAAQVAHDIRSPLVALDAALRHAAAMPEEQRVMLRHAVNRIRDIANNLLEKNRQPGGAAVPAPEGGTAAEICLLSSLIEPVIAEKRMQYGLSGAALDFEPSQEAYGLFAAVGAAEFRRVLSNLLNNAVEALEKEGRVTVTLGAAGGTAVVKIKDNGKGIPAELLARLGKKGATFGKSGGSGLGLYHAKSAVEGWGGKLAIRSEHGRGTEVLVELPSAAAPAWFTPGLDLRAGGRVVVLDDDETIHRVWRGRFESARAAEKGVELYSFSSPDKLRAWVKENAAAAAATRYLLDYELLGSRDTGLSLARELGIERNALLVTSRYEERHIVEECRRLQMRMIPKGLAGLVPIHIYPAARSMAVLVDDDALVRMNWKTAARAAGVELKAFSSPEELYAAGELPKDAAIYIDSELGGGVKGEEIAAALKDKGYTNLCLETGHPPEEFRRFEWLKVTGKEPPWA